MHIIDFKNFPLTDYSTNLFYVYDTSPNTRWYELIYNSNQYFSLQCSFSIQPIDIADPEDIIFKLN